MIWYESIYIVRQIVPTGVQIVQLFFHAQLFKCIVTPLDNTYYWFTHWFAAGLTVPWTNRAIPGFIPPDIGPVYGIPCSMDNKIYISYMMQKNNW